MYRVLIADDEPIERTVITKFLLKHYGEELDITQATNGREAICLFEQKCCDIAILDIEMPGINGIEAAETIKKFSPKSIIIFLTAFDDFGYAKKAFSVRALEYLLKPGNDEEIVAAMDEAIRITEEQKSITVFQNNRCLEIQEQIGNSTSNEFKIESDIELARMGATRKIITNFILLNYQNDISLQVAADEMNYTDAYFCKIFKQCFGKNFTIYLAEFRVERAKELLNDITLNVKDISECVGYRDANYFAKVFKRVTGMTPSEYRITCLQ